MGRLQLLALGWALLLATGPGARAQSLEPQARLAPNLAPRTTQDAPGRWQDCCHYSGIASSTCVSANMPAPPCLPTPLPACAGLHPSPGRALCRRRLQGVPAARCARRRHWRAPVLSPTGHCGHAVLFSCHLQAGMAGSSPRTRCPTLQPSPRSLKRPRQAGCISEPGGPGEPSRHRSDACPADARACTRGSADAGTCGALHAFLSFAVQAAGLNMARFFLADDESAPALLLGPGAPRFALRCRAAPAAAAPHASTWAASQTSDQRPACLLSSSGEIDETTAKGLDFIIAEAAKHGIRLTLGGRGACACTAGTP